MLKMKQAEHDKVVTALCEKHEEEINKLKSDSCGLVNQIVTKTFNNGSRHAQKVKEPRVRRGRGCPRRVNEFYTEVVV